MLLSFDLMKNTNLHKIVQNLKIRFNGEVYEGARHFSQNSNICTILCISFMKHNSVLSCEHGT